MNLLIGILQYNKWNITKKCIKCIIENTEKTTNYKILLLDNSSTDDSLLRITEEFKSNEKVIIISNNKNDGVIGGRNKIFDYFDENKDFSDLLFLDNDQFVNKNWIKGYLDKKELDSESIIGIEAWILGRHLAPVRKCNDKDLHFTYVGCGGMMISRSSFEKLGKFDFDFNPAYFEDPDYCLRANQNGIKVFWNSSSKIDHLAHQTLGTKGLNASVIFKKSLNKFRSKWKNEYLGGPVFSRS